MGNFLDKDSFVMVLWCPVSCNIPYVFLFINAKVIVQFHAKCLVVFGFFFKKKDL